MARSFDALPASASPESGGGRGPRVLILTAAIGSGHVRAAEAVGAALRREYEGTGSAPPAEVELVEMLSLAPAPVARVCRDFYIGLVRRSPRLVGWLYRASDRANRAGLRGAMLRSAFSAVQKVIQERRPDVIVATHFFAAEIAARLRRRGECGPLIVVVTDSDVHGLWVHEGVDLYCVAGEVGARTLDTLGVAPERVAVHGIPIDPAFERLPPRDWARRVLDMDPHLPLLLFTTGGCCVGPVEAVFRELLQINRPAQVVAICGRSEEMRRRLSEISATVGAARVGTRVEGFSDRMHIWMAAADLMIGKPGGLTSSECRAAALPMVLVHTIPGQEERNARALLDGGCAISAPDPLRAPGSMRRRLEELLDDRAGMVAMSRAAAASASPASARAVAREVTSVLAPVRRSGGALRFASFTGAWRGV